MSIKSKNAKLLQSLSCLLFLVFICHIPSAIGAEHEDILQINDLIVLVDGENVKTPPQMLADYFGKIETENYRKRYDIFSRISTLKDYQNYRQRLKEQFKKSFGEFPKKNPLNVTIHDVIEKDEYRIEKITYESRPGFLVPANVYVPANKWSPPYPGVVSLIGHWEPALIGKAQKDVQARCIGLVRRGYVVITFDPSGQGERCNFWDFAASKSTLGMNTNCHAYLNFPLRLTGENLAAWFTWDAIRAIDYLLQRGDVDSSRLAVTGASGGGNATRFIGAVDPRISALIPVCSMFYRGIDFRPGLSNPDGDQNLPLSLHFGIERLDQLLVNKPKGVLILNASGDKGSVMQAAEAYARIKDLYEKLNLNTVADLRIIGARHGYNRNFREAMYLWLDKLFNKQDVNPTEKEMRFHSQQELSITGSTIYQELHSESEFSINAQKARQITPAIPVLLNLPEVKSYRKDIICSMKKVLQLPENIPVPKAKLVSSKKLRGMKIEKLVLQTEDSLQLPAVILKPIKAEKKLGAVLYLHERGKVNGIETLRKLQGRNFMVMALDVRGYKEEVSPFPCQKTMQDIKKFQLFWEKNGDGYLTAESYELGIPLFGLRVADVIRGLKYLKSLPEVDSEKIIIFAEGDDALLALHAGLFEYWVRAVVLNGFLNSWLSLTQTDSYCQSPFVFVPNILKYYDVPHLVVALAPRQIILSNPTNAMHQVESAEKFKHNYPQTSTTFRNIKAESNLTVANLTLEQLVKATEKLFN
ncbi:MAG: hypothetical protein GXO75_18865 [Calditrichaeota bacterium]|nr:hypothetical protein [Calditrichota bacterium]